MAALAGRDWTREVWQALGAQCDGNQPFAAALESHRTCTTLRGGSRPSSARSESKPSAVALAIMRNGWSPLGAAGEGERRVEYAEDALLRVKLIKYLVSYMELSGLCCAV